MSKYLRDESHSKIESYSKQEIDDLIPTKVYTKDDFAILEYTIPAEYLIPGANWSNTCNLGFYKLLPEGFREDNTIIVSKMFKTEALPGLINDKLIPYLVNDVTGWISENRQVYNEGQIYNIGISEASIYTIENGVGEFEGKDGWGGLAFSFTWGCYSNELKTNDKPIHLKFLIMKTGRLEV